MMISRHSSVRTILAALAFALSGSAASAGSLQISTTILEVADPGMATSLRLRNAGAAPINVQIRAYEWNQFAGSEQLSETDRIIASPPFAKIAPGREFTVRVVRTAKRRDRAEDSFRLLVDEIPTRRSNHQLGVRFAVRYSIPVFFTRRDAGARALVWQAIASEGAVRLSARNMGGRRVRISALRLTGANGRTIANRRGLVGYVLAKSSMSWRFRALNRAANRSRVVLSANTDNGPIHVPIRLAAGR